MQHHEDTTAERQNDKKTNTQSLKRMYVRKENANAQRHKEKLKLAYKDPKTKRQTQRHNYTMTRRHSSTKARRRNDVKTQRHKDTTHQRRCHTNTKTQPHKDTTTQQHKGKKEKQ